MYTPEFEHALMHAMIYEVGPHFELTPEVEAGLISTKAQRRAVGYVNIPEDNGGETKFGIAKNSDPSLDITNLTWAQAKQIYFERYWILGKCDRLLSPRIAILHFDGCVNHGVGRANRILQQAIDVKDDGIIGPVTLGAINTTASDIEICNKICDIREQFYKNIVNRRPSQSIFLNGWLRRIREMRQYVCDPYADFIDE